MAAAPVKSPLHNFPLTYLKWGSKKDQQRCHSSKHHLGSRSSRNRRHPTTTTTATPPPQTPTTPQTQTHDDNNNNNDDNGDESNRKNPETSQAVQEEGWNLRPRRATAANTANAANMAAESSGHDAFVPKSTRLRGFESNQGNGGSERREEKRFFIALSRDEIEEDIYSMTGSKPSRRPKKRPKNVQKQLDNVFPGLWLVGFTPETYRGFDFPLKR